RLTAATRECVAQTVVLRAGPWAPPSSDNGLKRGLGLLVIDGLIVRHVGVAGRFGAELIADGDVICPWQWADGEATLPRSGRWRVLQDCRLAVLDAAVTMRLGRYPEVFSSLFARAQQRSRHVAVNMAIVQQPRIDVRLHMLFWELADRFGRVRQDGVHVPIALTHATLADLVAARRPTVTKALGELAERAAVVWTGEDWLLPGDPPAELEEVGSVSVSPGDPGDPPERGVAP
ncbi:MAG: family transcriptional regulator, cyclic receptor protein, partial [Solirubrobacteraceae bacterium]|nr:family transcriptional regulator, cyclic receptor protein [Solirubrobacteraceae bacterium]